MLIAVVGVVAWWPSAAAGEAVAYDHPVQAEVNDLFRPPPTPWSAGNRGIDYETPPGVEVRAAARGRVLFAGQVGGPVHVTLAHRDGMRSSYSFLESASVSEGQDVAAGEVLGRTGGPLHFGFRDPDDEYVDPMTLLGRRSARLVPGGDDGAPVPRTGLGPALEQMWETAALAHSLPGSAGGRIAPLGSMLLDTHLLVAVPRVQTNLAVRLGSADPCTAAEVSPPDPTGRRLVVTVAGFASDSEAAGIDDLDTAALGYDPGDVVRFSYSGGAVPPTGGELSELSGSHYDATHSQRDLNEAAELLVELLGDISRLAPGVPVDVVAHSQGGIVARLALARSGEALPSEVESLVTVASPHGGAPLAAAGSDLATTPRGRDLLEALGEMGLAVEVGQPALGQLAPGSDVLAELDAAGAPERVRFASIAARGDPVVPEGRTVVDGAARATVPVMGTGAHSEVLSSDALTREIALARAGMAPTCSSSVATVADVLAGESIEMFQGGLAALAAESADAEGGPW